MNKTRILTPRPCAPCWSSSARALLSVEFTPTSPDESYLWLLEEEIEVLKGDPRF
jgi:hypothetical protein